MYRRNILAAAALAVTAGCGAIGGSSNPAGTIEAEVVENPPAGITPTPYSNVDHEKYRTVVNDVVSKYEQNNSANYAQVEYYPKEKKSVLDEYESLAISGDSAYISYQEYTVQIVVTVYQ
ncbi:hypothetical protein [Halobaculum litoreum]|uniref:Uncharacterized protein n=1 Tax=Halobaculum litoreum TaxID=3031998 RepID=A0ABD5XWC4_9EURY|nr:hypothetical protein [Halobaculum sp. DT92]